MKKFSPENAKPWACSRTGLEFYYYLSDLWTSKWDTKIQRGPEAVIAVRHSAEAEAEPLPEAPATRRQ